MGIEAHQCFKHFCSQPSNLEPSPAASAKAARSAAISAAALSLASFDAGGSANPNNSLGSSAEFSHASLSVLFCSLSFAAKSAVVATNPADTPTMSAAAFIASVWTLFPSFTRWSASSTGSESADPALAQSTCA